MKKLVFIFALILSLILPINVSAKSYNFNWTCDNKVSQNDGTYKMVCHLYLTTDFEVNKIEGALILNNVELKEVKTSSDWNNDNNLDTDVSFTSVTAHKGSFLIANFIFTGNESDTECEASFAPRLVDKVSDNYVCAIIDDEYYGKNGEKTTEEKYYEECCNYTCAIVDNKYYFDNNGKSVSKEAFMEVCSTPNVDNPYTGVNSGYIFVPIGILSIIGILVFTKKNTKIYKI